MLWRHLNLRADGFVRDIRLVSEYENYRKTLDELNQTLCTLSNLSIFDGEMKDDSEMIQSGLLNQIEVLKAKLQKDKLAKLSDEVQCCQAKFNYYQKIARAVMKMLRHPVLLDEGDSQLFNPFESLPEKSPVFPVMKPNQSLPKLVDSIYRTQITESLENFINSF